MPVDPAAETLPGRQLANAIFRAAEHGLDATLHFALEETAVGFRLRATPGYAERSQAYLEGATAYLEAFEAELRRLDSAVRAGGSRSEAAWVEIKAVTRQELAVWRQAFEQADLHPEWQAALPGAGGPRRAARREGVGRPVLAVLDPPAPRVGAAPLLGRVHTRVRGRCPASGRGPRLGRSADEPCD